MLVRGADFDSHLRLNLYRALALLGVVVIPLWGVLQYASGLQVVEPPGLRAGLTGLCLLFLLLSLFSPAFVRHIRLVALALCYFASIFAAILLLWNDYSMVTTAGMLLTFVAVTAGMHSPGELAVFLAAHLSFAAIAPWFVADPVVSPALYFVCTVTLGAFVIIIHIARLRSDRMRKETQLALHSAMGRLETEVEDRTRALQMSNELLQREVEYRRRAVTFLHARGRVQDGLSHGGSLQAMLAQVCQIIEEIHEGMISSILLTDVEGLRLYCAAAPGIPNYYIDAVDGMPIGPESGICGTAAFYRTPIFTADLLQERSCQQYHAAIERSGLRGCCSVPFLDSTGKILGVLGIYYLTARTPDELELEFIKTCAHYVGAAVERKRTEDALEQSRIRYRLATGAARVGVWDLNLVTGEVYVDPILKEFLGYADHDLDSDIAVLMSFIPRSDRLRILRAGQAHLKGRTPNLVFEHRIQRRDGQVCWLMVRGSAIRGADGRAIRMLGTDTDITEFKQAEIAVHESEEKFRSLSEAAFEGLLVLDGRTVINANEKFGEMFACQSDQTVGRLLTDFLAPECRSGAEACLEDLPGRVLEFTGLRSSGEAFPVEINLSRYWQGGRELCVAAFRDLTDRKNLESSEALHQVIVASAADAILTVNLDGLIESVNPAAENMFGYGPGEMPGIALRELIPTIEPVNQAADYTPGEFERRGEEYVALRSTGAEFPVEITMSRAEFDNRTLYTGFVRDITQRKEAERNLDIFARNLERVTSELSRFIRTASGPIFCVDSDGRVIEWNDASARITGLGKSDIIGEKFIDTCVVPRDRPALNDLMRRASEGEAVTNFEFTLSARDGRVARVLMNASAGQDSTGPAPVWCVGQDITELNEYRSRLEQKVIERTQDLIGALEKEKELGDLRARFVSMASHEFRTPLSTIQTTTDLLLHYGDRIDRDRAREYLIGVQSEIYHMTELLDDILIFGKGEAGKLTFRPELIDVAALCQELVHKYEVITDSADRFHWDCQVSRKPVLDEKLVRLILSNLISNAVKYSPEESPVRIRVKSDEDGTVLEVVDQGIGITEEDQSELFRPFHRGTNVGNRSGTGLGLSIIKMAVGMHCGTIELDTRENRGTRITVFLPHAQQSAVVAV